MLPDHNNTIDNYTLDISTTESITETTAEMKVEEEEEYDDEKNFGSPFYMLSRMVTNVFKVWPSLANRYTTTVTPEELETSTEIVTTTTTTQESIIEVESRRSDEEAVNKFTTVHFTSEVTSSESEPGSCLEWRRVCATSPAPSTETEAPTTTLASVTEESTTEDDLSCEGERLAYVAVHLRDLTRN